MNDVGHFPDVSLWTPTCSIDEVSRRVSNCHAHYSSLWSRVWKQDQSNSIQEHVIKLGESLIFYSVSQSFRSIYFPRNSTSTGWIKLHVLFFSICAEFTITCYFSAHAEFTSACWFLAPVLKYPAHAVSQHMCWNIQHMMFSSTSAEISSTCCFSAHVLNLATCSFFIISARGMPEACYFSAHAEFTSTCWLLAPVLKYPTYAVFQHWNIQHMLFSSTCAEISSTCWLEDAHAVFQHMCSI